MSTEGRIPEPLTESQLRALLEEALISGGGEHTYHALYDHPERELTADDTLHAIRGEWAYGRAPRFNSHEWQWKYELHGESVDGDKIVVIVAVDTPNKQFFIVTRWRDDE